MKNRIPAPDIHVLHAPSGWIARSRPQRTQRAAVALGVAFAKAVRAELHVHRRDGRIRRKDSHGNDPKGRKG